MSMHHMHACWPRRPEEDVGSVGTGVTDACGPPCGFWATMWILGIKSRTSGRTVKILLTTGLYIYPQLPTLFLKGHNSLACHDPWSKYRLHVWKPELNETLLVRKSVWRRKPQRTVWRHSLATGMCLLSPSAFGCALHKLSTCVSKPSSWQSEA